MGLLKDVRRKGACVLDAIKYYFVAGLIVLVFGEGYMIHQKTQEVYKLQSLIDQQKSASEQLAKTKQEEVKKTESRADTFLEKAKADYEKRVTNNSSPRPNRVHKSTASTPVAADTVCSFQEPTRVVETSTEMKKPDDSGCEDRYLELWNTWQGLCLIYGCTD